MFLFKENTPDEEERVGAQQAFNSSPSQGPGNAEKRRGDTGGIEDKEDDDDEGFDDAPPDVDLDIQPDAHTPRIRRIFSRISSFVCPSPSNEEEIQAYIPHYRALPILSGIAIPFCILLEIPGLTEPWYIHTSGQTILTAKPNPPFIDIVLALSIACGVLASVFLVVRFLERRIKAMTILCIVFLSIHDMLNIAALATFGATANGFTYGQAFWMTLCSTIVSAFTNVTLIVDFVRTSDFEHSGSGLTRRQRSLVIIIIGLFCYIALGSLVNALLLDLTFIDGLYFTVVTIETIGFGDIVPTNRSSRVFICFYATLGVVNLAFVVGYLRETVLEGINLKYRKRLLEIQERRRVARRRRRAEKRWKHAIMWRLRQRHAPVWIPRDKSSHQSLWSKLESCFWNVKWGIGAASTAEGSTGEGHRHGMKLNLWALPRCQLEAAALEAGVPLDTFLSADFYDTYNPDTCNHALDVDHHSLPSWFAVHPVYHRYDHAPKSLTHRRLGVMAAMLTKLSLAIYEYGGSPLPHEPIIQDSSAGDVPDSSGSLGMTSSEDSRDYRADVVETERRAYTARSGLSWIWFLIFWMGGAAIFKATEGWTYGLSIYFCFISFTTIGYGDLTPTTPASRCIFVVWALVGVATMTIFISVVSDAYSSRYKNILGRNTFRHVVKRYRQRTKAELNEKVEQMGTSGGVRFVRHDTLEREQQMDIVEESSPRASDVSDDEGEGAGPAAAATTTLESESDAHVQRSLEQLPQQILVETRSIQQYMQLIGDEGSTEAVQGTLWTLIDEIMGKEVPKSTKIDILRDGESRQTLMMLRIERSLKELVSMSEQAIEAIRERNRVIAVLRDEKERGGAGDR